MCVCVWVSYTFVCPPGDKQIVCPPGDKQNVTDRQTNEALYIYRCQAVNTKTYRS